jgi:hypothetical protein
MRKILYRFLFLSLFTLNVFKVFGDVGITFTVTDNSYLQSGAVIMSANASIPIKIEFKKDASDVSTGNFYLYLMRPNSTIKTTLISQTTVSWSNFKDVTHQTYTWSGNISVNIADLTPGTQNMSPYLYVEYVSNTTAITPSNVINIQKILENNTIQANQTITSGSQPTSLTGSTPTGAVNYYSYQWQKATSTSFTDIAGANARDYQPPVLTTTTKYRRVVKSGDYQSNTSGEVTITVTGSTNPNEDPVTPQLPPTIICEIVQPNLGSSLYFDGIDDKVYFNLDLSSACEIEFWAKPLDFSRNQVVVSIGDFSIGFENRKVFIRDYPTYSNGLNQQITELRTVYSTSLDNLTNNTWHNFKIEIKSYNNVSDNLYIYCDGVNVLSWNSVKYVYPRKGPDGFIGYSKYSPNFQGAIKNLRIKANPSLEEYCWRFDDLCNLQYINDQITQRVALLGRTSFLESSDPTVVNETSVNSNFSKDALVKYYKTGVINSEISTASKSVIIQSRESLTLTNGAKIGPNITLKIKNQNNCGIPPLTVNISGPSTIQQYANGTWTVNVSNAVSSNALTYQWSTSTDGGTTWYNSSTSATDGATMYNSKGIYWRVTVSNGLQMGASSTFVSCSNCSSSSSSLSTQSLSVSPNPSSDFIDVTVEDSSVKDKSINKELAKERKFSLYNSFGTLLYDAKSKNSSPLRIFIGNLREGMYILVVETEKEVLEKNIIVNK